MNNPKSFRNIMDSVRDSLHYKVEGVVLKFTEQTAKRMLALQVNQSELAVKTGSTPAYVSKVLRGGTNFTVESMVKISDALGAELSVEMVPKSCAKVWVARALECQPQRPHVLTILSNLKKKEQADEESTFIGPRFDSAPCQLLTAW